VIKKISKQSGGKFVRISSKYALAIHCLLYISEYQDSKKVTSDLLSSSTGSNAVTVRSVMSSLKKAGLITTSPGTGGSALALPLEQIDLYRILMASDPDSVERLIPLHAFPNQKCPVGRNIEAVLEVPFAKVQENLAETLKSITMKDIAKRFHELLKKDPQYSSN
jgi:DNA-binding IscR family transcriptional regulator